MILAIVFVFGIGQFLLYQETKSGTKPSAPFTVAEAKKGESTKATPVAKNETARLLFVGDMMLGRNVEVLRNQKGNQYPFEVITPFLSGFDMVMGNLEGPIVKDHTPTKSGSTRFAFDESVAEDLFRNNIKVVSISNNHTYDYGADAYVYTQKTLIDAGVTPVGHPKLQSSEYVVEKIVNGQKLILIAFNPFDYGFKLTDAVETVKNASVDSNALVIVNMHVGIEYDLTSSEPQRRVAHAFIDNGADIVIGHHPHVTQEIEVYKEKAIFYSLGNFIFDQYFSVDTEQGFAVGVDATKDSLAFAIYPIQSVRSQPGLMENDTAFLLALAERSTPGFKSEIAQGRFTLLR